MRRRRVFIAFRHLVHSRREETAYLTLNGGHVFIAFRHLVHSRPHDKIASRERQTRNCLHCLSAFSSFTTVRGAVELMSGVVSSLPFGI
ncbi:MAG: hypothetical protein M2R45_03556 [Verrucomicrobia subdivision 3 bacterium]|nr:hypothetical protein [Limisphaerales bacterium]MCS1416467.1 hypothetical protein [Limisphaerales bacterium]